MALNGCFLAVVGAGAGEAGYAATRKDRTAGEVVSDQWIFAKVRSSLDTDSRIVSRNITVEVRKGAVTLTGTVPDAAQGKLAGEVAAVINGVKSVRNRLKTP
ncbi:MAG: BON domain-containing protein [Elusimicrobia bacterium]|nr:BON domain-containing protein [Elusimicrobiota bacterium]